jgi:hypothetical protein
MEDRIKMTLKEIVIKDIVMCEWINLVQYKDVVVHTVMNIKVT